ncbi:calmodulin-binding transcription activator [Rhynchospora pubera]|uniref:Calmodulin-binding transcription activator n=1 Tax=Rhynchospora pubera TaxID=906938 RepID=A0AAV8GQC5_9POAL|nr:calmodulin-binding transcription activator [Rhynchospora pubera]
MEASDWSEPLAAAEIHGFRTVADLNIKKLIEEAPTRWFRPNEVHAILCNYTLLRVQPQPIVNPTSGTMLLYDRKVVRNFRKDGHNWRKKKDGKAVQEAHEKLKVGNDERVHVYYARGEDDPNFYRRCYWLLDKELERIVLVHYRRTSEENAFSPGEAVLGIGELTPLPGKNLNLSPLTPESNSISQHSEVSGGGMFFDEFHSESNNGNKEFTLEEINTLDWDDLLESPTQNKSTPNQQGGFVSVVSQVNPSNIMDIRNGTFTPTQGLYNQPLDTLTDYTGSQSLTNGAQLGGLDKKESPGLMNDPLTEPLSVQNFIFNITDVSPDWAYCADETKALVVGDFHDQFGHLYQSNIYCIIGGKCVNAESIKAGVFRVLIPPNTPGSVELYLTLDCQTPISQVTTFTYLSEPHKPTNGIQNPEPESKWEEMCLQTRLGRLLFLGKLSSMSNKLPPKLLKEASKFASQTSPVMEKYWTDLVKQINEKKANTKGLLEMVLRNRVQEWLLEKVSEGCKITPLDEEGQGVIHLCAMLDYVWAVWLFAFSGLSLDFRDSAGWTALHWAAYYGRERMVANLLSAGANPSLVTDPTPDFPGGVTAADLAAKQGFEGLAAYLAEKCLTAHFEAMSLHGNLNSDISSKSVSTSKPEDPHFANLSEQELCLKESLAAYRNAADAATKIQAAFRERALKRQTEVAKMENSESEAESIVAALRIQNAYRNHNRKKAMRAAARIQSHFRTWKTRKNFLTMRSHAIHIQAVFRGHQVRRQYKKLTWSVGVLEKAILRWRHKRRGLRGMQTAELTVAMRVDCEPTSSSGEEEFFRISREQAEERLTRSVVRVQALFRSYKAQQEYRRMKETYEQAEVLPSLPPSLSLSLSLSLPCSVPLLILGDNLLSWVKLNSDPI